MTISTQAERDARVRRAAFIAGGIAIGLVLALAIAETAVRALGVDTRRAARILYYQSQDTEVMRADPDPWLLYRLAPRAIKRAAAYDVHIDENGARRAPDAPRAAEGESVTRVVCLGGSNTFGFHVSDHQTWPARLESELNARLSKTVEVHNFGVNAYVPCQMARLGDAAMASVSPDVVIVSLTNGGVRPFLIGTDVEPYFRRDPWLWRNMIFTTPMLEAAGRLPAGAGGVLARFSAVYRALALSRITGALLVYHNQRAAEIDNIRMFREFVGRARASAKVAVFLTPAVDSGPFDPYLEGLRLPVFKLDAGGRTDSYRDIHPPARVLKWYAENLADWLIRNKLVG